MVQKKFDKKSFFLMTQNEPMMGFIRNKQDSTFYMDKVSVTIEKDLRW
jgi:hypothetical protein